MRRGPAEVLPNTVVRVAVAVLLTAGAIAVQPVRVDAASTWTAQASPNAPATPYAGLVGVACATATRCFAVGSSLSAVGESALIEQRTASNWTVVDKSTPGGATRSRLMAVACADSTHCVAVGDQQTRGHHLGLVEHWNGTGWTIRAFPSVPSISQLAAIACPTASTCFAVGSRYGPRVIPVVARWNGTTWSIVPTPSITGSASLQGVACSSSSDCFAVGAAPSADGPLIEQWDGSAWSIVAGPQADQGALSAVTCRSSTECFAAGDRGGVIPLAERWDGSQWSIVATDNGVDAAQFAGVACPTDTDCFAVGSQLSTKVLIERWTGTNFTEVAGPNSPGIGSDQLAGIACPAAAACAAVGSTGSRTAAAAWGGTDWSATPSATPAPPDSALASVVCTSATNCVAVGHNTTTSRGDASLVERWNGHRWSIEPALDPQAFLRRLTGVACASATRCFAVGTENAADSDLHGFIEQWDGKRWSSVSGAEVLNEPDSELFGAACASASRCFAFGYSYATGHQSPLIKAWNGHTWSVAASPEVDFGSLYDASCPTPTTCYAVGLSGGSAPSPLIERWTGGKWTVMNAPVPDGQLGQLSGVACASLTNCVAVGPYYASGIPGPTRAFVERWDGARWRVTTGLTPAHASSGAFAGVACRSATSCVAVGQYTLDDIARPLIERWNGAQWKFESNPSPAGARLTALGDVSCPVGTACAAVGSSIDRNAQRTYVERHP